MKRKTRKNIKSFSLPCILFAGIFSLNVALNSHITIQKQTKPDHKQQDFAVNAIPPEYLNCDDKCIYGLVEGITVDKIRQEGYTTLQIPDYIEKIADNAFFNMFDGLSTHVDTLLLGKELKVIGDNAFWGCSGFTNTIDFSTTQIEQIGTSAFADCTNIPGINFIHENPKEHETLQSIGECCFANCEGITEIILPDSLQNIQNYAFDNCNRAGKIDLSKYEVIPQWVINNSKVFRNCGGRFKEEEKNIFVNLKSASLSQWDELLKNHREIGSPLIVTPSSITSTTVNSYFITKDEEWEWGGQTFKLDTYRLRDDIDLSNIYTIFVPKEAKALKLDFDKKNIAHPLNIDFEENSQLEAISCTWLGESKHIYGELKLPDSLHYIGGFERSHITKLTLPNNNTWYMSGGAFNNSSLIELVIPSRALSNTNYCGNGVFNSCNLLSFIDCQLPTNFSEIPWKRRDDFTSWFKNLNSTGTIILPKEIGLSESDDKARLQAFENNMISLGFPENSLYDMYTTELKPENKWLVASYEENRFPDDSFLMNQKKEIYKLSDNFDAKKNECDILQLPDDTRTVKSHVFKDRLSSTDSGIHKTWVFRPNANLSTIQNEAFANNSSDSPACQSGLLIENVLPNTISKMDNPFGTNYNIRGCFTIPSSTVELTNFSLEHTNITKLIIPPTLKVFTAKKANGSSSALKSPFLRDIDLTAFRTWDDFEKLQWDPFVFDLEHFDWKTDEHFIYISDAPEGTSITDWMRQITDWIERLRSSVFLLETLHGIGWSVMPIR